MGDKFQNRNTGARLVEIEALRAFVGSVSGTLSSWLEVHLTALIYRVRDSIKVGRTLNHGVGGGYGGEARGKVSVTLRPGSLSSRRTVP